MLPGQLSHWLHCAIDNRVNTSFVLIDRSHVRNKVECEMPWHKTNALDFVSSEDLDQTEKCPCLIKVFTVHM